MILALTDKLTWYTARASGLIAWAVVTASILWGLTLSSRLIRRRGIPAWLLDLHRYLGTLTIVFTAVHMTALGLDKYVKFGFKELFVPMASKWAPGAVAWGIVAMYLIVAIQLTSWVMRRLPRRLWHAIHLTSFPLFVFSTIHGLKAGADRNNLLVQWATFVGIIMLVSLILFRLLTIPERRRGRGRRAKAKAAATLAEITGEAHEPEPAGAR